MGRPLAPIAVVVAVTAVSAAASCGDDDQPLAATDPNPTDTTSSGHATDATGASDAIGAATMTHPTVLATDATFDAAEGTWTFDVTISSPYDTPERYADGWRVMGVDGAVYGVHTLLHDHATEQPFTRRQRGVVIPDDVDTVVIEGRDLVNGFGGQTLTIDLER